MYAMVEAMRRLRVAMEGSSTVSARLTIVIGFAALSKIDTHISVPINVFTNVPNANRFHCDTNSLCQPLADVA